MIDFTVTWLPPIWVMMLPQKFSPATTLTTLELAVDGEDVPVAAVGVEVLLLLHADRATVAATHAAAATTARIRIFKTAPFKSSGIVLLVKTIPIPIVNFTQRRAGLR
jgi:hypothetical protein